MGVCRWVTLALAVGVAYVFNDVRTNLGYDKQVSFSDGSCRLLSMPTPIEDLSALGDGHCLFGGGGDLWNSFMHGSAKAQNGGVWLINATAGRAKQLSISGAAVPRKLVLHGIFFGQTSRRLYAVNHDVESGESIEVFEIKEEISFKEVKTSGESMEVYEPMSLKHIATVRSEMFNMYALNDVVEGVDGEFYVTEWLPFGFPQRGKKTSDLTSMQKLQKLAFAPINLFKIRTTRIFRCKLGDQPECQVATPHRFVMANGIAISDDRQSIFVSDPGGRTVEVLARQSDGTLKHVSAFKPKHIVDNLEMQADGTLSAGSIPLPFATGTACEEGLGATRIVDGRTIECGKSPGGMLHISLLGTGGQSFVDGTQTDHAMHDGSKLDGVSAAVKVGSKIVIGSPSSPGVLLCDA